uniref:Beta-barrel porin 2 n=1 Tax=Candidatus Kentrum sp. MB TaxID=2138164 RepID=A0A450XJ06_9GAMM|nr:MAG: hypothetical protein BECKMB1821G_GA0114241_102332 [Candidatus Kentron sp. MB]VFK29303.1 MAG: hypothetical protein BECKMB1821I_GA0114274_100920 [Candidatus Kentron sp. MB]VFK74735.1 MAG: hypothetical protein BECKMB1821H_GA0114242_100920 [Candidatus Kentron sp. MB]
MKRKSIYFPCFFIGLSLVEIASASDIVNYHESLDVYRHYCNDRTFCTVNRYSTSTTDFDEVDDVRNFTSEALYASSASRLNRPLTDAELRGIVRNKNKFETFNSIRLDKFDWAQIRLFYKYRDLEDSQITQFFAPNTFNDVTLNEYGFGLDIPVIRPSDSINYRITLHGGYRRANRNGVVEFSPNVGEDIDHVEIGGQWEWGEEKRGKYEGQVSVLYAYQDIEPDVANPSTRDRHIFAVKARYTPNAWEFIGGFALDEEQYGNTFVDKNDIFVGISHNWDDWKATLQPTLFTSDVDDDASQRNSQYRTNIVFESNKYDEGAKKDNGYSWAIPIHHDLAIDGPDSFENFKVGAELRWKNDKCFSSIGCFISIRYDYQDFYNIEKRVNAVGANISIHF